MIGGKRGTINLINGKRRMFMDTSITKDFAPLNAARKSPEKAVSQDCGKEKKKKAAEVF